MLALDLPDGVLAWYSTIHVPDERLPEAFAEFHRVLAPSGYLLLAFQAGEGSEHATEALGTPSRSYSGTGCPTTSLTCSARPTLWCVPGCCAT